MDRLSHRQLRNRIDATGIGYAGIDGLWWLPANEPFPLDRCVEEELTRIGTALFAFFDLVSAMLKDGSSPALTRLMTHRVPLDLEKAVGEAPVQLVRPDFQLTRRADGHLQPVITELEISPSAQGFAHAMQVGYEMHQDLVGRFVRFLGDYELLILFSAKWSPFLFDQLAFCRAISEAGGRARLLPDVPIDRLARSIRNGELWQPPMFGVRDQPERWNLDLLGRLRDSGFHPFLAHHDIWSEPIDRSIIFRFGYLDCFSQRKRDALFRWKRQGAGFLNPANYFLDSKVLLAALTVEDVRERLPAAAPGALPVLQRCIPETLLLTRALGRKLLAEQEAWVVKCAGFDAGEQSWGGNSLRVGASMGKGQWQRSIARGMDERFPFVAQRLAPGVKVDITYLDQQGDANMISQGSTRLRAFFLRDGLQPAACGVHLTVSKAEHNVAEGTGSVQAPIIFV